MTTFKERLLTESIELREKISKLNAFLSTEQFEKLDVQNQVLLKIQLNYMQAYRIVLYERISIN